MLVDSVSTELCLLVVCGSLGSLGDRASAKPSYRSLVTFSLCNGKRSSYAFCSPWYPPRSVVR